MSEGMEIELDDRIIDGEEDENDTFAFEDDDTWWDTVVQLPSTPEEAYKSLCEWLKMDIPYKLKKTHPIPEFDDHVEFFEEDHYYLVDGLRYRGSGTGIVHSMFPEFDEKKTITRIVGSARWQNDSAYRYYKRSAEDIAQEWEEIRTDASERGTAMHAYIEYRYNDLIPAHIPRSLLGEEYTYYHSFHDNHIVAERDLEAFRTELIIIDVPCELVGTIDMLYRKRNRPADGSEDHLLYMYDWKRSKKLNYTGFGKDAYGYGPCHFMPDCNIYHYYFQLNLYKFAIERNTRYRIVDMHLAVFHPNHGKPMIVPVPPYQEVVLVVCGLRRRNLLREDRKHLSAGFSELDAGKLSDEQRAKLQLRAEQFRRLISSWPTEQAPGTIPKELSLLLERVMECVRDGSGSVAAWNKFCKVLDDTPYDYYVQAANIAVPFGGQHLGLVHDKNAPEEKNLA